jgi:phenylalanyl-tRNA synthetase beta chain
MPTLAVAKNFLFSLLGATYTETQFEALCFEFGVELDDVTSAREMFIREHGAGKDVVDKAAALSDEVIYKIDTPANRYDLLSAEGMSIALKVFKGMMAAPRFVVLNRASPLYKVAVDRNIKGVRDFVVCAVLKDIRFNPNSYNSFIDFQEKLHSGLARRRTLASVGTHDMKKLNMSKIQYTVTPKEQISFVPLNQTKELNCAGDGLEQYYKDDRHIGKFVPLIAKLPGYPTIRDGSGTLMSLPPIINSDFSKISIDTTDVFIECTAPDHHKASVLVNQMVCAFSAYCKNPFTVEAVEVVYEGGATEVTPNLDTREMTVDLETVNKRVGIALTTADECAALLNKMCLYASRSMRGW